MTFHNFRNFTYPVKHFIMCAGGDQVDLYTNESTGHITQAFGIDIESGTGNNACLNKFLNPLMNRST